MRHSKPNPQYTDAYVHFHNLIEITAKRETESKTSYIFTYLPIEQARRIQQTLNFMDKYNVNSIGHSAWHIDNNQLEPCEWCKKDN